MNPGTKFALTLGAGVLAFLLLLALAGSLLGAVDEPLAGDADAGAGTVAEQLWSQNNITIVLLAVTLFGGVMGVLALVGGEFRWR